MHVPTYYWCGYTLRRTAEPDTETRNRGPLDEPTMPASYTNGCRPPISKVFAHPTHTDPRAQLRKHLVRQDRCRNQRIPSVEPLSGFDTCHTTAPRAILTAKHSAARRVGDSCIQPRFSVSKRIPETNKRVNELMKRTFSPILLLIAGAIAVTLPACARMNAEEGGEKHEQGHKIILTSPEYKDVTITRPYVCQIHAQKHVEIKALEEGYLEKINVSEGQAVTEGQVMFNVYPPVYKARLAAEEAEAKFAEVELKNTRMLYDQKVVSRQEVSLYEAKLNRANARVDLAKAELQFTDVKAPFTGIMDRLFKQKGSLVKKDEVLTTLSDISTMWVYFNVPESRYLEYMNGLGKLDKDRRIELLNSKIELQLANGKIFNEKPDPRVTIEGKFNNETGNIAFRADFPNPHGVLRHGQTGTILVHQYVKQAIIIPQRATFEILDQRYVWVVGDDKVAHQRPIEIKHELEDKFVIESGITIKDKIVLEGVQQVHDGQKLDEVEFEDPAKALSHQKFHAE